MFLHFRPGEPQQGLPVVSCGVVEHGVQQEAQHLPYFFVCKADCLHIAAVHGEAAQGQAAVLPQDFVQQAFGSLERADVPRLRILADGVAFLYHQQVAEARFAYLREAAADELRRLNDRRYEDSRIAELVTVIEQETAALKE